MPVQYPCLINHVRPRQFYTRVPSWCNMHITHPCALAMVVNAHGVTHVGLPLAMWNYHFVINFVFDVIFDIV